MVGDRPPIIIPLIDLELVLFDLPPFWVNDNVSFHNHITLPKADACSGEDRFPRAS